MNLRPQLALFGVLLLGDVSAARALDALQKSGYIDVPAQRLPSALRDLSWQTRVDIICDPQDCEGIAARPVLGTQTVQKALDTMLRGSRLHYEILDSRSIGIFPDHSAAVKPANHPKDIAPARDPNSAGTEAPLEEVLITGSNISGIADRLPPITTFSRRVLEESGAGSLEEFLSRLPQNLNSNSKATYAIGDTQNGARGSSVNLLGLGERGTLVLIDGHRVAESAMGNFVDVSLIPFAAVDRIEVLSEGAAAIYGADAVAGVVNIVLRRNFTGLETDVRNAWPNHSGAHELSATQTAGTDWGSGNLVSSFTYRRDERLWSSDRRYSDTPGYALLPALTDYDGYLFAHQDFSSHFWVDIDGLYSNRRTYDDANYVVNDVHIGPYQQRGVTNQYYVAPALKWTSDSGWHGVADFDVSQNRFTETTTYGAEAESGAAVYSTLSEARVRTMDVRVDGPFLHLPAGDAKLAVGLGERWEDYHSLGSSISAFATGSLRRHVAAAYGELYLPVIGSPNAVPGVQRLDFSLAVRGERYSGAGSTGNPKLGFLWQPLEHLSVRGSYGTSFATARYSQTLLAYNALVIKHTTSSACASGTCLIAEELGAGPSYRPERSRSYTVGLEWTPEEPAGLQVSANYYSINYRDQIGAPPDTDTLLAHTAAYAGIVVPNPTPSYLSGVFGRAASYPQGVLNLAGAYDRDAIDFYIDERTRNFAQTLATGIDVDLGYDLPSSYGVWSLGLNATRVLKLDDRASPVAPDVPVVDTFAHPLSRRYQGRVGLRASSGITVQLRANYLGSYTNNQVTPSEPVASWTTFDATFVAPLDRILPAFGGRVRLELSIDNMFNRDPPHVRTLSVPDGYDPVLANALGRVIALHFVARL